MTKRLGYKLAFALNYLVISRLIYIGLFLVAFETGDQTECASEAIPSVHWQPKRVNNPILHTSYGVAFVVFQALTIRPFQVLS